MEKTAEAPRRAVNSEIARAKVAEVMPGGQNGGDRVARGVFVGSAVGGFVGGV